MLTPIDDEAEALEISILERMLELRDTWKRQNGNRFRLEVAVARSFDDEYERAVISDVPLIPFVFGIMSVPCLIIFPKCDRVQSRSLLGFGAVVTVLLAIITSFGLLFLCGVPFTSLTQVGCTEGCIRRALRPVFTLTLLSLQLTDSSFYTLWDRSR